MKVFLTEAIHADAVAMLEQHGQVVQGTTKDPEGIVVQAQGCDAILVRSAVITAAMMQQLPGLKAVAKHGIGVDNIDVQGATAQGILVLNAPFSNVNAVAEHALAMILDISKNMTLLDKVTRAGGFAKRTQYVNVEVSGKTVGLVGFGKIAKLLAKKLGCMDVNIIACDPVADPKEAKDLNVTLTTFDEVLAQSDFVSLHTPLLPETQHMMNKQSLSQMKPSAFLINVARGPLVDEAALLKALTTGVIAGAALDVFDPEPPLADNPLFALDNVLFSPHNAALTDNALLAMAMDSATGIVDYLEGRNPLYPVNPEVLRNQ